MSEVKWTKGPWSTAPEIDGVYSGWRTWVKGKNSGVAVCKNQTRSGVFRASQEEAEANANLIAAAPELYEALMVAREYIAKVHGTLAPLQNGDSIVKPDLDKCDAALAKARGESQ